MYLNIYLLLKFFTIILKDSDFLNYYLLASLIYTRPNIKALLPCDGSRKLN